jgi:hypothetical protein
MMSSGKYEKIAPVITNINKIRRFIFTDFPISRSMKITRAAQLFRLRAV